MFDMLFLVAVALDLAHGVPITYVHPQMLRPIVQPVATRAGGPRIRGTVTTITPYPFGISTIAYDSDDDLIYAAQGQTLYSVTPAGKSTMIRTLPGVIGGLLYDPATKSVYVTILNLYEIVYFTGNGPINVLAGGSFGTADGQGAAAQFQDPTNMALDPTNGDLYVADRDRMRQVDTAGNVTTITAPGAVGSANRNYYSELGVAFDSRDGNLYVADAIQDVVHRVTLGGAVTTLAGRCILIDGRCADYQLDGRGTRAFFDQPWGIAYDAAQDAFYVGDSNNRQIRKVTAAGVVTTFAGGGRIGNDDGIGVSASFEGPVSVAIDPRNALLYVADTNNMPALRTVTTTGASPPPPPHAVVTLGTPTLLSAPFDIAKGPDGNLWFTEQSAGSVGRLTSTGSFREFRLPAGFASPENIISGSDGNIWFADFYDPSYGGFRNGAFGKATTTGAISEILITNNSNLSGEPTSAGPLALGSDGNIWFGGRNPFSLGFVTPGGLLTQYLGVAVSGIATGFDGDVWVANGYIYRYATDGTLLHIYKGVDASDIVAGPDQRMWFLDSNSNRVGSLTLNGLSVEFGLTNCPQYQCIPNHIVLGGDGALWFTEGGIGFFGSIARITTDGALTTIPVPSPRSNPGGMTVSIDGKVWFADPGAEKLGYAY